MNVLHVARRELASSFTTVVGWMVLCVWLVVTGLSWVFMLSIYMESSQNLVFDAYAASRLRLADALFAPFFGNCAVMLVFLMPILSMRTFSEEMSRRTLELLLTSPISTTEIVFGKYLGLLGLVGVLLGSTLQFPLGLAYWADLDLGALAAAYLGLFLLSATLGALGMLASSFTSNQIVAAGTAFAAALGLVLVEWGAETPDDALAQLAITTHLGAMLQGSVKLSDLTYYVAFSGFCLFATHQRMESFRWR
jgi:ABC-2 type transport system permease protein